MTEEQAAAEQQPDEAARLCPRCETLLAVEAHFDSAMWVCPQCGHMEAFGMEMLARDKGSLKRSDRAAK